MLACVVTVSALLAHPVTLVQLRHPAHRVTITTTSGYNVTYTLATDSPIELRRAYKLLEAAERELLISESLQLLRMELVANERLLENLRTTRLVAYLTDQRSSAQLMFFDPAVFAPTESTLKGRLSEIIAEEARIERLIDAINRLADAHYYLLQTLTAIAYPDRKPVANARPVPLPAPPGPVAAARASSPIAEAEKAEKAAADAEALAEERERDARQKERGSEEAYRAAAPAERAAAKAVWLNARDEWEAARRDWDAAREKWQAARDRLEALRKPAPVVRPTTRPGTRPR
jgi:hypothetical protein